VTVTGGYAIDATEVSRAHYEAWIATNPSTAVQPSFCAWNTNFTPKCEWPPGTEADRPVVCLDWCDAHAYCEAIGKRLCGRIGGGENDFSAYADPTQSQWYNACSSAGLNNYPYGGDPSVYEYDGYDAQKCNGKHLGVGTSLPSGTLSSCQSSVPGFEGVYDLSGNVQEWEDSCDGNAGGADTCRRRGGDFNVGLNSGSGYGMSCSDAYSAFRDGYGALTGVRCCSQ